MTMAADNIPPFIATQLNYLISHFPLTLKVTRTNTVSLYLASQKTWDVIYNMECPTAAPDVIFEPEDEDFHLFHMVPNRKRVGEVDDDRLKFEISTILSREEIKMHMISGAGKPEEVKFAVPLMDININRMVPGCPWRHSQKMYLQVIYPVGRNYVSTPSSPHLKLLSTSELKALFSVDDVKLPPWLDGMCMAEYLPHLEDCLEKQVREAILFIDVGRRFIEALACQFGRPVEADLVFCRKATVLAASGVFTFVVHFLIPTQFPKQELALMLQSSQHVNSKMVPIKSRLLTDYPWSSRWEASQMAERILRGFELKERVKPASISTVALPENDDVAVCKVVD